MHISLLDKFTRSTLKYLSAGEEISCFDLHGRINSNTADKIELATISTRMEKLQEQGLISWRLKQDAILYRLTEFGKQEWAKFTAI